MPNFDGIIVFIVLLLVAGITLVVPLAAVPLLLIGAFRSERPRPQYLALARGAAATGGVVLVAAGLAPFLGDEMPFVLAFFVLLSWGVGASIIFASWPAKGTTPPKA